jgi:glutathione S-transferase
MKLYYAPGTCSLSPHIVLCETQLPFTLEKVTLSTHLTEHGEDYYTINPKGQVPLLVLDNGDKLTEGQVINQYLCDLAARGDLVPAAGTGERYHVMEWLGYVASELHKSYTPLFNGALDAAAKATLSAGLRKKYEWLDQQLGSRPYLVGDHCTAADIYLFVVSRWSAAVKLDLSDLANLQACLKRVADRPAVQQAMRAEGLIS